MDKSEASPAPLGRLVIYTHKLEQMAAFYSKFFGFEIVERPGDRITELRPPGGGAAILLHPATARQREGQALVKLVFDVRDVPGFCAWAAAQGLRFGAIHLAGGYAFANARDPGGNRVQVSSRAFVPG